MGRISRIWLEAENLEPAPGLLAAIERADVILFGPGSLFTSILPNLLIPGVAEAIRDSSALKVQVCNLMTQPGETDGFRASDHLRVLLRYLGEGAIDACVMNSGSLPRARSFSLRKSSGLHQLVTNRVADQLGTVMQLELAHEVCFVGVHRLHAEIQTLCDFLERVAARQ